MEVTSALDNRYWRSPRRTRQVLVKGKSVCLWNVEKSEGTASSCTGIKVLKLHLFRCSLNLSGPYLLLKNAEYEFLSNGKEPAFEAIGCENNPGATFMMPGSCRRWCIQGPVNVAAFEMLMRASDQRHWKAVDEEPACVTPQEADEVASH